MNHFTEEIEEGLQSLDYQGQQPPELYRPIAYILSRGGKRMRPVLLLSACKMFSGEYKHAVPQALAIEMFHNFTLIHDDIMDEAPRRRGNPTIHEKWDKNIGILSGDLLMIKAYGQLAQCEASQLSDILNVFNQTGTLVCEGQQLDMNFESLSSVSIDDYIRMISLKTAALLEGSLKIGAIRGGASDGDTREIGHFGRNLGIAFQLQDDILDAYGDPHKFGKQMAGDIVANKKTVLSITALNLAKGETLNKLSELYENNGERENEKVPEVLEIFRQLGVKEKAVALMNSYYDKATRSLAQVSVPGDAKKPLQEIADKLRIREI